MGLCDDTNDWNKRAKNNKRTLEENGCSHPISQKKARESICLVDRLSNEEGDIHVSFAPPLLSEALYSKDVWRDGNCDPTVGFILTCSGEMSDEELTGRIKDKLLGKGQTPVGQSPSQLSDDPVRMRRAVYEFLCSSSDSLDQVIDAVDTFNRSSFDYELPGEADLRWWNVDPIRAEYYRRLTFFRRLIRPLCIKVLQEDGTFVASKSNLSLLHILLDLPHLQEFAIDSILLQACCFPDEDHISGMESKFLRSLLEKVDTMVKSNMIQDMAAYQLVAAFVCCVRPGLENKLPSVPAGLDFDRSVTNKLKARLWREYMDRVSGKAALKQTTIHNQAVDSKSCDPSMLEERRTFQKRRHDMMEEHKKRNKEVKTQNDGAPRQSARKTVPMGREADGSIVYTGQDMSLPQFMDEFTVMDKVNQSFPRYCNPEKSRPRMQQVQLSDEKTRELKKLIFDADGSLSNKIKHDIDTSSKHGYINFTNLLCNEQRKDQRWQVPIRKHGAGSVITTRAVVENLLTGIFDPRSEALYDLGILIGGTEDQSLHHDVARQCVSWIPEKVHSVDGVGMNPVGGWEIDRLGYNEAMSSPNAPSSVLICMGDAEEVLLGVQKDQVIRSKNASNMCRILGGKKGQTFEIVRENEFLVVLRAKTGVMFTGDFPHAGVRNVKVGSKQDDLLKLLNEGIAGVLDQFSEQDRLGQTRAIVEVLCNFPNLDQLCRLHASTEITTGNLCIPANTIGFCDCLANPPDARCLEDDTPPPPEEEKASHVLVTAPDDDDSDESSDEEPEWVDDDASEAEWVGNEDDSVPTLCSSTAGGHTKNFAQFNS
jgi:hypothetical protein